jgi:ferritin
LRNLNQNSKKHLRKGEKLEEIMIAKKMVDALNAQINKELNSAYIYLGMVDYFVSENYDGMASWMKAQAHEELEHAEKLINFVQERSGKVDYPAIEKVTNKYKSPLAAFKAGLEHEKFISASIHELYELALAEKDYGTQEMLRWFISEQVEEESNFENVIGKLEMVADAPGGLMIMDGKLGYRKE